MRPFMNFWLRRRLAGGLCDSIKAFLPQESCRLEHRTQNPMLKQNVRAADRFKLIIRRSRFAGLRAFVRSRLKTLQKCFT